MEVLGLMSILVHKEQSIFSKRAAARKAVKPTLINIIQNYDNSVFDRGNIETKMMNYFWEGCEAEHIAGGRTKEDLKKNRRLCNWLCDRLIDLLNPENMSFYHMHDIPKDYAEYCYFCKQQTVIYDNFCPRCKNWTSNFEDNDKK